MWTLYRAYLKCFFAFPMPPGLQPKQVLFLLPDLAFGGVERITLNLLRHLPVNLFTCDLFTCGTSTAMACELPAAVRHFSGVDSGLRMRQAFPRLVTRLRNLVHRYEVVVATSPHTTALMHLACFGHKARKISWVHFNSENFLPSTGALIRVAARIAYPLTEERIFVSERVQKSFEACLGNKRGDCVIHNIFDPDSYIQSSRVAPTVKQLKSTGKPILGVVSRLVEGKGLMDLIAIHQELRNRSFNHHLVVIGDGPLKNHLSQRIDALGLRDSFHLLGEDPSPLASMRLFDLLLLTSEHEAWPTVILEAFHAETPIVSFDCPSGPGEMLTGKLRAGLVPGRDPQVFANSVVQALTQRTELVGAGTRRLEEFMPERIIPYWVGYLLKERLSGPIYNA